MFSGFEKGFIVVAFLAIAVVFVASNYEAPTETYEVKQLASCEELNNFVESSADYYPIYDNFLKRLVYDLIFHT